MKHISFIFIFLALCALSLQAQKIHLSGYISDAQNNERIINAYVIEKNNQLAAISNDYGFFSLALPLTNKAYCLVVSNIAYKADTLWLTVSADTSLQIKLQPGRFLAEVEVSGSKPEPIAKRNEISTVSVPMRQIELLPAFGGERDIIKAYQLMPGVQSGNEGSSGLHVRGGSPDQNLILIDGAPVYYVNHLAGFVSVFNNDALKSTKLYKGGFPARYSGRLSSVLDVRMKDGDNQKFGGSASIGLLSAKVMVEGPIQNGKSSYLFSYRRMLYDLLMRPISKLTTKNTSAGYNFQDLNLKLNHTFSDKDRLYLSLYYGDDRLKIKFKDKELGTKTNSQYARNWGNLLGALRWNHIFNNKLFSNLSASYTRYRFHTGIDFNMTDPDKETQENSSDFYSGIADYGLNADFEYYVSSFYKLRFGAMTTMHCFRPSVSQRLAKINGNNVVNDKKDGVTIHAAEAGVYTENEFNFSKIIANVGCRYDIYKPDHETHHYVEPRLLLKYLVSEEHSVQLSYARMHQNMHLMSSANLGLPVDFWLPALDKAVPPTSHQYVVAYSGTIANDFELSVEAFYKRMDNLSTFKEGASYFSTNDSWLDKMEVGGKGKVYGIDVLLQKSFGLISGWLGYTFMKNTRQFAHINAGKAYPYKYDRTHDINLVLNYKFADNIDFSVTWVYGTGQALTLPVAKYYLPYPVDMYADIEHPYYNQVYVYTDKNAFRAAPYHRMDIGINFRKEKPWGERVWNLSIYNLYNRRNPYMYYIRSSDGVDSNKPALYQQSLFPFIPSVSYSVKF